MIAIKDVGMPKNCAECMVRQNCKVSDEWDEFDWYYGGRLDGCPLVEIDERKVGKWVKKYQYGNDYCSECNYENCGYGYPKFCPNCGAKMGGVQE